MSHSGPIRAIGTWQLIFVAVSSMVGSSWLFAALYTSQLAGPAGILSVLIGGVIILGIAMVYSELATLFPVGGGSARMPFISHGGMAGYIVGFLNWTAYAAVAPLEVTALVEYSADLLPLLTTTANGEKELSGYGLMVAIPLLFLLVVLNMLGVKLLAKLNQPMAIWKLAIPVITIIAFALSRFETSNFTAGGGFAPMGTQGVLGAVAAGGCVVAYLGFRSVLEMAGEVKNPGRSIPLAMIGGIVFCMILYSLLNVTFVGALEPQAIAAGWENLVSNTKAGPIAAIALQLGLAWLMTLLLIDAVVSPGGTALIYTGVTARVGRAMHQNGAFPAFFAKLNRHGVPAWGILFNFVVGVILLMPFPGWQSMMGIISSALVLSLGFGPISLLAFRKQFPERKRPFRLPFATPFAAVCFIFCSFVVYWAGWRTNQMLAILFGIALVLYPVLVHHVGKHRVDWRPALWIVPYFVGIFLISALGQYDGLKIIPSGVDLILIATLSIIILILALRERRPDAEAHESIQELDFEIGPAVREAPKTHS